MPAIVIAFTCPKCKQKYQLMMDAPASFAAVQGNDFVCPKCRIGRFSGTEDRNAPIGLLGPVLKYQPEGKGFWIAMDGTNWVSSRDRTPPQGRTVHVIAIGPERNESYDLSRLRGTFVGDHWNLTRKRRTRGKCSCGLTCQ